MDLIGQVASLHVVVIKHRGDGTDQIPHCDESGGLWPEPWRNKITEWRCSATCWKVQRRSKLNYGLPRQSFFLLQSSRLMLNNGCSWSLISTTVPQKQCYMENKAKVRSTDVGIASGKQGRNTQSNFQSDTNLTLK